jgi:hypothetical protein
MGFTSLPENATMANARYSTAVAAAAIYGLGSAQEIATNAAWQAVGVGSAPPPGPCIVTVSTVPFESAHPYDANFVCTWVYTNPTPNYRFHFDLLDLEEGFDYVDILDANDNLIESVTGTFRSGYTSAVIPTQVGKLRLRTDQFINKRGFRVDAILAP